MASLVSCHIEKGLCAANLSSNVQHASARMATQFAHNTSLVSDDATVEAKVVLLVLQRRPFRYGKLPVCLPVQYLMISCCECIMHVHGKTSSL